MMLVGPMLYLAIELMAPLPAQADLSQRTFVGSFIGDFAEVENYFSISGAANRSSSSGSFYLEKTVSSHSSISIFGGLERLQVDGEGAGGWDNVEVTYKQNLISMEREEFVLSVGLSFELPVGSRNIGAETHVREGFEVLFGKAMGNLPDTVAWLRPAAIEGGAAWQGKFTGARDDLISGFAELEYSFDYLGEHVRGFHVIRAIHDLTPHLDFDYLQYMSAHRNSTAPSFELTPGLAWLNSTFEINLGAQFGLNRASSEQGPVAFVWLVGVSYDELLPATKWTPFR